MSKYFIDCEFVEDGRTIDLISIGIACEDGRTLYKQNAECQFTKASDWVWRNVFPHLAHFDMRGRRLCYERRKSNDSGLGHSVTTQCGNKIDDPCPWATRFEIAAAVREFCNVEAHGKPEFWGYFGDYDWVCFCQLFGTMMELPKGFPMFCMDLKQTEVTMGIQAPKPEIDIHHALTDALWIKGAYEFLHPLPTANAGET